MKNEFKIDTNIYDEEKIKKAIIDFQSVSDIEFKDFSLTIYGENELEIQEIFNEFMNYIISL